MAIAGLMLGQIPAGGVIGEAMERLAAENADLRAQNLALNRHVLELIGFIERGITDLNPVWLAGVRADAEAAVSGPSDVVCIHCGKPGTHRVCADCYEEVSDGE